MLWPWFDFAFTPNPVDLSITFTPKLLRTAELSIVSTEGVVTAFFSLDRTRTASLDEVRVREFRERTETFYFVSSPDLSNGRLLLLTSSKIGALTFGNDMVPVMQESGCDRRWCAMQHF